MNSVDKISGAELIARGWQRCFIADEPRLSEAVETYEELGFEVALAPVTSQDADCTECMMQDPHRFKVIYTRKRTDGDNPQGRGKLRPDQRPGNGDL